MEITGDGGDNFGMILFTSNGLMMGKGCTSLCKHW
jgi:hypothetical protein